MLAQGSTFYLARRPEHLHIIATDPALDQGRVMIVPVVTFRKEWRNPDSSCLLQPGVHARIIRLSAVDYSRGYVGPVSALLRAIESGEVLPQAPITNSAILGALVDGARKTMRLPEDCAEHIERIIRASRG